MTQGTNKISEMNARRFPFRDWIFPIISRDISTQFINPVQILGTGFYIGHEGYCLSALHVVENNEDVRGAFIVDNVWVSARLDVISVHPSEDLVLLRTRTPNVPSPLLIKPGLMPSASHKYISFGYPDYVLHEFVEDRDSLGRVLPNPDLVCTIGYIKRRISNNLPALRGESFLELSEVSGLGYSGSPIIAQDFDLSGIYVGERLNDVVPVGYALRVDAFADWVPEELGVSLSRLTS